VFAKGNNQQHCQAVFKLI